MTAPVAADRVRFIEHDGVRIVLLDFEGITDPEVGIAMAAQAKAFFARLKPDGSTLSLTDVRNTRYDKRVVDAFRDLTAHNKPYVRAAAVITNSTLHKAAISMVAMVTRRKLQVFETREPAIEYLVTEHRAAQSNS